MKKLTKRLKELKVGQVVEIEWGDPSADPVEDGSAEELVEEYVEVQYRVVGYFLGINKKGHKKGDHIIFGHPKELLRLSK